MHNAGERRGGSAERKRRKTEEEEEKDKKEKGNDGTTKEGTGDVRYASVDSKLRTAPGGNDERERRGRRRKLIGENLCSRRL